jgi:hypothetical protein
MHPNLPRLSRSHQEQKYVARNKFDAIAVPFSDSIKFVRANAKPEVRGQSLENRQKNREIVKGDVWLTEK